MVIVVVVVVVVVSGVPRNFVRAEGKGGFNKFS